MKKEIVLYGFLNDVDIYSSYPGPDVNEGKPCPRQGATGKDNTIYYYSSTTL